MARSIEDGAEFLKTPISIIINKSINSGIVQEEMKFETHFEEK